MKEGNWEGGGMGRGIGDSETSVEEWQKRWLDGHENEWKYSSDQGEMVQAGHLQDKTEAWNKGGTQESMGVTLAVTYNIGNMEPEEATSCSQAGTPVEW